MFVKGTQLNLNDNVTKFIDICYNIEKYTEAQLEKLGKDPLNSVVTSKRVL